MTVASGGWYTARSESLVPPEGCFIHRRPRRSKALANTKSAAKRNRANQRRRVENQKVRSEVRTIVKKAREAIGKDPGAAKKAFDVAARELARAASKGVVHKRNASRHISRLARALNAGKPLAAPAQ